MESVRVATDHMWLNIEQLSTCSISEWKIYIGIDAHNEKVLTHLKLKKKYIKLRRINEIQVMYTKAIWCSFLTRKTRGLYLVTEVVMFNLTLIDLVYFG